MTPDAWLYQYDTGNKFVSLKRIDSVATVSPLYLEPAWPETPDIRDLAAALPLTAASLEMLIGVAQRFADQLEREGISTADVLDHLADALIAAEVSRPITPEDRRGWAADDAANARCDERRLERMA